MPLTEPPPWLTHRTYRDVPYYAGIADYVALWVHSRRRLAKAELTLQPVRSLAADSLWCWCRTLWHRSHTVEGLPPAAFPVNRRRLAPSISVGLSRLVACRCPGPDVGAGCRSVLVGRSAAAIGGIVVLLLRQPATPPRTWTSRSDDPGEVGGWGRWRGPG